MRQDWTVLVDTRERRPLPFPETIALLDDTKPPHWKRMVTARLRRKPLRLETGDYALEGYEKRCLVETKRGARELVGNCLTRDRDRFVSCLDRLSSACDIPILVVEGTLHHLYQEEDGEAALDSLTRLCCERRILLSFCPADTQVARIGLASWIARTLVSAAVQPAAPLQPPKEPIRDPHADPVSRHAVA